MASEQISLLLFVFIGLCRMCRNRFRLNDGFGKGFRWDAFGLSAPSCYISLCRSLPTASLSIHFHFRLNGDLGTGLRWNAFGLRQREVREIELALLAETLNG
jgi:hypothetical protein